jgi:hypothetical protein
MNALSMRSSAALAKGSTDMLDHHTEVRPYHPPNSFLGFQRRTTCITTGKATFSWREYAGHASSVSTLSVLCGVA